MRIGENDTVMEKKSNKTKWLHVRLSIDENKQVNKEWKKTTCLKRSEYIRKIILGKPVVSTYRNRSLDDLMAELIRLRNDLNAVGNNFNQAVKKLHTLDRIGQVQTWISAYEQDKTSVMQAIAGIENSISKLSDQWLQ